MSEGKIRAAPAENVRIILTGVLTDPALRAALGLGEGRPVQVPGALSNAPCAGLDQEGWPVFDPASPGEFAGVEIGRNPALDRYARIMGLRPLPSAAGSLLGVQQPVPQDMALDAGRVGAAAAPGDGAIMRDAAWRRAEADCGSPVAAVLPQPPSQHPEAQPALAAAIAAAIASLPDSVDETAIRGRLPMIGVWAASQLRAATAAARAPTASARAPAGPAGADSGSGDGLAGDSGALAAPVPHAPAPAGRAACKAAGQGVPPASRHLARDRVRILSRAEPYAHFFAVEELRLTHRLHGGGWSDPLDRAVFVSGDAVVVLPWDPMRDRVLVIDQFRAGPAARLDPDPWLIEAVAGRIDAGETPESTAHREALEEAGLTLHRLIPAPGHYPSPAILAEYLYSFIGITDLPDGSAGIAGLETEGEDIRGQLMPRAQLTQLALQGRLANGPLILLALWLDRMADDLRAGGPTDWPTDGPKLPATGPEPD